MCDKIFAHTETPFQLQLLVALASFELHPTPSYVVKEMIGRYKAGAKI
jgi:hypothetical protein